MSEYDLVAGDTFELDLQVFQRGTTTPLPIVGAKVWSTVKARLEDADVAALSQVDSAAGSVPAGGGIDILDASLGTINVRHSPLMAAGITDPRTVLFYDVQIKVGDGRVWTLDYGTINIIPDVTRTQT